MMPTFLLLAAAHAGSLTVSVDADGRTSEVTLDHIAPCELQRFERDGDGQKVELGAVVEPQEGGGLLVTLDITRTLRGDGPWRKLQLGPAIEVADGTTSTLGFTVDGAKAVVKVKAKGFGDDDVVCRTRSSRTRSSSTRRTRGTPSEAPATEE